MSKLKYKVGDKVRIKSLDWYNENKTEYGRIDCGSRFFFTEMSDWCGKIATIKKICKTNCYRLEEYDYDWTDEMIEGLVEEETKNNNDMEEKETLLGWVKENDSLRLVPHKDYEIKHDGDNFYLVKKKKEYPKTYEECCEILQYNKYLTVYPPFDADIPNYDALHLFDLLEALRKLIICRDAYWKIAGEEMGLDKPWEPSKDEMVYSIYRHSNKIGTEMFLGKSVTFEFPTAEMRDALYENFKKEIEICKELL